MQRNDDSIETQIRERFEREVADAMLSNTGQLVVLGRALNAAYGGDANGIAVALDGIAADVTDDEAHWLVAHREHATEWLRERIELQNERQEAQEIARQRGDDDYDLTPF